MQLSWTIRNNSLLRIFGMYIKHTIHITVFCSFVLADPVGWALSGICPCPWQRGWNQMTFKVPSNLSHSMILWLFIIEYRVCDFKNIHSMYSCIAVVQTRYTPIQLPCWKTSACWCQPSSMAAISPLKYPYIFSDLRGQLCQGVPLCQQLSAEGSLPTHSLPLPHSGAAHGESKAGNWGALKRLAVWIKTCI